ncbi:MAG: ATPase, T2SS/T4P/T4SS family [bacterium]
MPKGTPSSRKKIGDVLLEAGVITPEQLEQALLAQKGNKRRLAYLLVDLGLAKEKDIVPVLGAFLGIPFMDLSQLNLEEISPRVKSIIPEFLMRRHLLIPISLKEANLSIAMADPLDVLALDDIARMTGYQIISFIACESEIKEAIDSYYKKFLTLEEILKETRGKGKIELIGDREEEADVSKLKVDAESGPVINVVNHLLIEAISAGASDVHIEPYKNQLRTRYRIDGMLHEVSSPPKELHAAIVSRVKIMSRLDIAERRLPQDGRCKAVLEDRDVDLRISIIPTAFGEKVVLRILDPESLCLELTELGFEPEALPVYKKKIDNPYGIILVTGPTSSGKSTTLYSTLKILNTIDKNIITVEDPVEYVIEGINQVQIKPEIGLDFVTGLRSFMRQDPNILMVGEIRDRETAEVAINAALTGHLVFSTLHTNDAPGAITRLVNMGVEPFLITSTVIMSLSQRLVRIICPACKESYQVSRAMLQEIGFPSREESSVLYKGAGCKKCANIGYKGRIGVFELMEMTDSIRDLVLDREPTYKIRDCAEAEGMISLKEATARKVFAGVTTVEEFLRITVEERALH